MASAKAPRGRTRLDYDERRGQILAVARRLFSERPYGAVSTTELAEAAGVTRGLLHHYFGTKRALYLEAVRNLVGNPIRDVVAALGEPATRGAGGRTWEEGVDTWMRLIERNWEAWLVAISAGETGHDAAMDEILNETRELTATQVIEALGVTESRSPEVRPLVRAFGSFAEEVTREWLQRKRLSRAQARVLLVGALPLMVEHLLPEVSKPASARPARRSPGAA